MNRKNFLKICGLAVVSAAAGILHKPGNDTFIGVDRSRGKDKTVITMLDTEGHVEWDSVVIVGSASASKLINMTVTDRDFAKIMTWYMSYQPSISEWQRKIYENGFKVAHGRGIL